MATETAAQAVDRALTILELLSEQGESGVAEIADELGVHKSTASRLLQALERRNLVEHAGERGRYHLGFGIVRLASGVVGQLDVTKRSLKTCESLVLRMDETTTVAIPDGNAEVVVLQVPGSAAVSTRNWVGQRTALHATSTGKVLLSEASDEELQRRLPESLMPFTSNTIVDYAIFRQHLSEAKRLGYALSFAELEEGLHAIAAPIRDANGRVIAALNVSGPAYRLTRARLLEMAPDVIDAAALISRDLGFIAA